jgi:Tfp pilus assembly protein PilF
MSIIHEALKKASRDEDPGHAIKGTRKVSASIASASLPQNALFRTVVIIFLIGIIFLGYWGRKDLGRIFTSSRTRTTPVSSLSGVLAAPSTTSARRQTLSEMPPRPDPANQKITEVSHEGSGMKYLKQGQLEEAEQEFLSAASLEPDSSAIQNNLGLILKRQGRDEEAESRYLTALRLDSRNVQAMNNLGLLYERQNRLEEAERLYQEAIVTQPSYPDPHLNLGVLLERAGYFMESKRHFQSFLSLAT